MSATASGVFSTDASACLSPHGFAFLRQGDHEVLAPLIEINSHLAQKWFDVAADELRGMGIALEQLPGAFHVNFIDGRESTAHILHTLEMAVAVGRIMAADLTHDRHR